MTFQLGDVITLRSGERCKLWGREFNAGGMAIWKLSCVSRHWFGTICMTTREILCNAV